jgi:hypothetical protein
MNKTVTQDEKLKILIDSIIAFKASLKTACKNCKGLQEIDEKKKVPLCYKCIIPRILSAMEETNEI